MGRLPPSVISYTGCPQKTVISVLGSFMASNQKVEENRPHLKFKNCILVGVYFLPLFDLRPFNPLK